MLNVWRDNTTYITIVCSLQFILVHMSSKDDRRMDAQRILQLQIHHPASTPSSSVKICLACSRETPMTFTMPTVSATPFTLDLNIPTTCVTFLNILQTADRQ